MKQKIKFELDTLIGVAMILGVLGFMILVAFGKADLSLFYFFLGMIFGLGLKYRNR